jgi:hypothetical protein
MPGLSVKAHEGKWTINRLFLIDPKPRQGRPIISAGIYAGAFGKSTRREMDNK